MHHSTCNIKGIKKTHGVSFYFVLSSVLWVMATSYVHAYPEMAQKEVEINSTPKTAIEIMTDKRIPETVLKDGRPAHVYRPRTPIFHKNHPENVPTKPVIKRHLLVDHPELNNNQGRNIRQDNQNNQNNQNNQDNMERVN